VNSTHAKALAVLHSQHGAARREQLRAVGLSDSSIKGWLSAGALTIAQPGVLALHSSPKSFERSCVELCLAVPGSVIGGRTAGRLWGFRQMPRGRNLLLVPATWQPTLSNAVIWRTRVLPVHHHVARPDGIILTAPHRTLLELAREIRTDDEFRSIMANVRDRFDVSLRLLHQLKREAAVQGRAGSARFNRVLSLESGRRPPQSKPEVILRDAFVAAGLPTPVEQFEMDLAVVGHIRADLAFPDARVIVEFDHSTWHAYGKTVVGRDKRRDRQLAALGWIVLRFDEDDVAHCLSDVVDEVAAVINLRLRGSNFVG
jgi:hypothetical protein